jgi:hypothetical protein
MKFSLVLSALVSVVVGGAAMYVAWEHNSQCEIHCEGVVHWGYWLFIGASWAIPIFLLGSGVILGVGEIRGIGQTGSDT